MKKIFIWLFKTENAMTCILIMLIAPLYFIFLSQYINEKTSQVLLSFASIISTILIFFTLREYSISNRLKAVEPRLIDFINEIQELESKSKQCIYSEPQIKLINSGINYPDNLLRNTSYLNFLGHQVQLYKSIENDPRYQYCINRLGDKETINIEDSNNVKEIGTTLNNVIEGNDRLLSFIMSLSTKYDEIDVSELVNEQKVFLFSKLNKLHSDYTYFYNKIKTKSSDEFKLLHDLYNFKLFMSNDGHNLYKHPGTIEWEFMFSMCKDIEEIVKKYK